MDNSPVREQLTTVHSREVQYLEYAKAERIRLVKLATRLIDGIEEALREWCHENCPSTPCESCRMAAVLERLLEGRNE